MNNIKAVVQWVLDQKHQKIGSCVLDYGCGRGEIVKELRHSNINAFGCDVFYEGGDYSVSIDPRYFDSGIIKKMSGTRIPFEDATFDFVVNKMVMEHVEDLDSVLAEIRRVLKPDGKVLSIFPDKTVWHEGHCGIPFLHWFAKGGHARIYYAAAWRSLGFGYHKGSKSIMRWSQDFCEWLDKWTFYRSKQQILTSYRNHFTDIRHIEETWLQLRLGKYKILVSWLPVPIQRLIVRKISTLVFVADRPPELL